MSIAVLQESDYLFQAGFVAENAWRLLSMQDSNPASPSYGCFHLAYWRDKTSEFPDGRFQEAGATLGLLALPRFDSWRDAGRLAPAPVLMAAFSAALSNWEVQQHPEGCWDEWYKGERGFAVTEFTMIAYGLANRFLGDRMAAPDRERLKRVMRRAGHWLSRRHDAVKANHEAAAAAALALAWEVTGEESFRKASRTCLNHTLARQQPEGWFPEVGGMDLGYCSVLLDYLMLATLVTGDEAAVPATRRLLSFMLPHLEPNGTISAQAGLCLNPYVSRLGMGLLSVWDDGAKTMVAEMRTFSPGHKGLEPTLADDLRFCRWSHLPLASLLLEGAMVAEGSLATYYPQGWTHRPDSGLLAYHQGDWHIFFAPAGGGCVRVYHGRDMLHEDRGMLLKHAGQTWCSSGYDPERPVVPVEGGWEMRGALHPAAFFFPGFLSRLILRVGCRFSWSSRLLRWAIDTYRMRARTAINQSAAPMAKGRKDFDFVRRLNVEDDLVMITDTLTSRHGVFPPDSVLLESDGPPASPPPGMPPCRVLVKTTHIDAKTARTEWHAP